MNDEKRMILQMVQDGTITVEEAQRLLDALPEEGSRAQPEALSVSVRPEAAPRRILINVTEHGKSKVNVRLPFKLVKTGLKIGKAAGAIGIKNANDENEAVMMEALQNLDVDEVLTALGDGDITLPYTVVDVMDEEKDTHVTVILE